MKQIIYTVLLMGLSVIAYGQDRFNIGVGVTSIIDPFEIGAQAKTKLSFSEKTGTAATLSFYLDKNVNWVLDIDQHYNNFISFGDFQMSPFAGINYLNQDSGNVWGINLGLFSDFELSSGRKLYVEPKYVFLKQRRFVLSVGTFF